MAVRHIENVSDLNDCLNHRLLTLGSMDPKEIYGDHKRREFYIFKPFLQVFRGPPMAFIDNLGVLGYFFDF